MSLDVAATEMGISRPTLAQACRKLGVAKWPYMVSSFPQETPPRATRLELFQGPRLNQIFLHGLTSPAPSGLRGRALLDSALSHFGFRDFMLS